jgi:hypothetical protein
MGNIDATVIYYSSNREDPLFEERIIQSLKENYGDLPIVSVTQKPIALGENHCVGDVGVSGFNMFRQVQMACHLAKTKFVISAEADCVYPPDYFEFQPAREDICYRNSNLYVMGDHRDYWYYKPTGATHAQVIGREYYLEALDKLFEGAPMWCPEEKNFPKERHHKDDVFRQVEYYRTPNPVFQIKTHRSMRYHTHSEREPITELPYWGKGIDVRAFYMKEVTEKYVS